MKTQKVAIHFVAFNLLVAAHMNVFAMDGHLSSTQHQSDFHTMCAFLFC